MLSLAVCVKALTSISGTNPHGCRYYLIGQKMKNLVGEELHSSLVKLKPNSLQIVCHCCKHTIAPLRNYLIIIVQMLPSLYCIHFRPN